MSGISDIAKELSAIASGLRVSSEATLSDRYAAAKLAYLDNTTDRLVEILEAEGYSVTVKKRSGSRILTAEESKQQGLFGAPEPKVPIIITLKWDGDMIDWEQDKAGHQVASGKVGALKNTPSASAKKVADGLER